MARVLFAWEFGGDLGHARRLVPIARALQALGHEPLFAFRELTLLGEAAHEGFPWFAAPRLRPPAALNPSPLNASDILLNLGYADASALNGALRAWLSFFTLVKPELVVADYAPTALLAARLASLPRVTIGTGFSVPREGDPLPALRSWAPVEKAVLERLDARLIASVSKALDRFSRAASAPRTAWEVFDAGAHLLCTFPELDPFGPREAVEYLGPQGDAESGVEVPWRDSTGPRVFAYLKPRDPRFGALLEGLRALNGDAIVAAPGLDPAQETALSSASLRVLARPVRLDRLLGEMNLCVSHAGPGLAARALAAGVPMALVPLQLEQYLVASRLVECGVARMVAPGESIADTDAWLASVLSDSTILEAARRQSIAHRDYRFGDAAERTARRIAAQVAR